MTTNYKGALEEIFSMFNVEVNSNSTAILGYIPKIQWPGETNDAPEDNSKYWLRISSKMVQSLQGTLSENVVQNGSKRYTSNGLIFVQIFAPKRKDSFTKNSEYSMMIQNIFRNSTSNVTLRNCVIKELAPEESCLRTNVISEFEFDEIP